MIDWYSVGFSALWIFLWLHFYRAPEKHPHITPGELAHIQSDPPGP